MTKIRSSLEQKLGRQSEEDAARRRRAILALHSPEPRRHTFRPRWPVMDRPLSADEIPFCTSEEPPA